MFGLKLIHISGNDSWGAWVTRPIEVLIRPTSMAMVAFVVLLVSFVRRELASVRKFAISLIMRHLRMLQTAMLLAAACMAGCDTAKPEKFAGFASEQLSEQIESVSAKLDESIEENHSAQVEILRAVRDLSETVAGMQLTSQEQINELKKVSGKAKVKLTSAGDEKEGVATLDPNGAPSAKLQLDSLDDAASIIEALTKRVDELDKRCQCGKATVSNAAAPTPTPACYVDANGNTVCPLQKQAVASTITYQGAPMPTSAVMSSYPITGYSSSSYQSFSGNSSGSSYSGGSTGTNAAWQSSTQQYSVEPVQQYRTGLFGRRIPVR